MLNAMKYKLVSTFYHTMRMITTVNEALSYDAFFIFWFAWNESRVSNELVMWTNCNSRFQQWTWFGCKKMCFNLFCMRGVLLLLPHSVEWHDICTSISLWWCSWPADQKIRLVPFDLKHSSDERIAPSHNKRLPAAKATVVLLKPPFLFVHILSFGVPLFFMSGTPRCNWARVPENWNRI